MTNYIYADDAAPVFPKGTIIHVTAWYDNTKANKNNPDPDQWVGYGDRTVDEMAHAWMNVVYLSDAEYQERVAKYGVGVTNGVKPQRRHSSSKLARQRTIRLAGPAFRGLPRRFSHRTSRPPARRSAQITIRGDCR